MLQWRQSDMADREWRGQWWLPDKPNNVVSGVLIEDEDGKVALKLIGGFSNVVLKPLRKTESAIAFEPEFVDQFSNHSRQCHRRAFYAIAMQSPPLWRRQAGHPSAACTVRYPPQ